MESEPELCRAAVGPRAPLTPSPGNGNGDTSYHKDPGVIEAPQRKTNHSYCLNVTCFPPPLPLARNHPLMTTKPGVYKTQT